MSGSNLADVVFVVESSANLSSYIGTLRDNYVRPILECFCGYELDDRDCGCDNSYNCNMYALVAFMCTDAPPDQVTKFCGFTHSSYELYKKFDSLEFSGGVVKMQSHLTEGLALAINSFAEMNTFRKKNIGITRHCVLIIDSYPYDIDNEFNFFYKGPNIKQLVHMMAKHQINLSILSPRRWKYLKTMFMLRGTQLDVDASELLIHDERHLLLLKNINIQRNERSVFADTFAPLQFAQQMKVQLETATSVQLPKIGNCENTANATASHYVDQHANPPINDQMEIESDDNDVEIIACIQNSTLLTSKPVARQRNKFVNNESFAALYFENRQHGIAQYRSAPSASPRVDIWKGIFEFSVHRVKYASVHGSIESDVVAGSPEIVPLNWPRNLAITFTDKLNWSLLRSKLEVNSWKVTIKVSEQLNDHLQGIVASSSAQVIGLMNFASHSNIKVIVVVYVGTCFIGWVPKNQDNFLQNDLQQCLWKI